MSCSARSVSCEIVGVDCPLWPGPLVKAELVQRELLAALHPLPSTLLPLLPQDWDDRWAIMWDLSEPFLWHHLLGCCRVSPVHCSRRRQCWQYGFLEGSERAP